MIFDQAGNLYGTTASGGAHRQGAVYELIHSGAGWTERLLYSFQGASDGADPFSSLIQDPAENLYGTTCCSGPHSGGTAFELAAGASNQFSFKTGGLPDGFFRASVTAVAKGGDEQGVAMPEVYFESRGGTLTPLEFDDFAARSAYNLGVDQ